MAAIREQFRCTFNPVLTMANKPGGYVTWIVINGVSYCAKGATLEACVLDLHDIVRTHAKGV